jgi:type VI secretion system protein ImpJ
MRLLSKVLWREGMHLSQHHFQAQSRYVEDTLAVAVGQLCFRPYGVTELAFDEPALRNGTVMLLSARGLMPDGLPFHIPESDAAPPARAVASVFSPTQLSHVLLLGIGSPGVDGATVSVSGGTSRRYVAESRTMRDAVSGRDEREVELGRKDFQLLLDHEPRNGLVTMPVARIRRDGSGYFALDTEFIPPCTKISGSARLLDLIARTLQVVEAKSDALAAERDAGRANVAEYAAHEVANFWLLHTLRANSSLLRHHLVTRESHPERVYVDLARLVGALSTFALQGSAGDVPRYDHDDLTTCFGELGRLLRSRLEVVVPSRAVRFPLQLAGDNTFVARVDDERCYRGAKWIVGLRSAAQDRTVIARAPELLKICSRRWTHELVKRARPGLVIAHLSTPPSVISPRSDAHYFAVTLEGPFWQDLRESREIGVYVPDVFTKPVVDLHVIMEETAS